MKPIIGLLAEIDDELKCKVKHTYVHAIELAGGAPVLLPYIEDVAVIQRLVEGCDGFLFTGGGDIDPRYYGEAMRETCGTPTPARDTLELALFAEAVRTDKPILGICRGIQVLNVALGGTLYQDIPSEIDGAIAHRKPEEDPPLHEVNVLPGTPLAHIANGARMTVNTYHHQAVKALGAGLQTMATADDGVIEAVYLPGERYLRGYQWHPERLVESHEAHLRLFEEFVAACRHK